MTSIQDVIDEREKVFQTEELFEETNIIKKPNHYTWHPIAECREIVQEFPYNLGTAMAYIWRNGRKGDKHQQVDDLLKAMEHITFEIQRIEKEL